MSRRQSSMYECVSTGSRSAARRGEALSRQVGRGLLPSGDIPERWPRGAALPQSHTTPLVHNALGLEPEVRCPPSGSCDDDSRDCQTRIAMEKPRIYGSEAGSSAAVARSIRSGEDLLAQTEGARNRMSLAGVRPHSSSSRNGSATSGGGSTARGRRSLSTSRSNSLASRKGSGLTRTPGMRISFRCSALDCHPTTGNPTCHRHRQRRGVALEHLGRATQA